jgi:hypothetical protein
MPFKPKFRESPANVCYHEISNLPRHGLPGRADIDFFSRKGFMSENLLLPVAPGKLQELESSVKAMIQFVPKGENLLKSLYEYWGILEENLNRLSKELDNEKKLAENRISVLEKSISYAEKFRRKPAPEKRPSDDAPLAYSASAEIQKYRENLNSQMEYSRENLFRPLEQRIREAQDLIGNALRAEQAEHPFCLKIEMRQIALDQAGSIFHVLTVPALPPIEYLKLCHVLLGRIPWKYDFFVDDVSSMESPDGLAWFTTDHPAVPRDFARTEEEYREIACTMPAPVTPIQSHIPIILPDDGPHYRLKHGTAFDSVGIFRAGDYDINLSDDEFARLTGYLYALKEDGLLDFVLTPMG